MRLGVMCSGSGTNFENIVRTCRKDEVVLMIYNKKDCGARQRALKLGIPSVYISSKEEYRIINEFKWARVDLIVMAGWMRIVSKHFVDSFPNKIINIHPSLLPKYKGLNAVQQALDSGDMVTGCTVHYVTEELDSGDIICQEEVQIFPHDTLQSLTKVIQQREYEILPRAIEHVKHELQIKTY